MELELKDGCDLINRKRPRGSYTRGRTQAGMQVTSSEGEEGGGWAGWDEDGRGQMPRRRRLFSPLRSHGTFAGAPGRLLSRSVKQTETKGALKSKGLAGPECNQQSRWASPQVPGPFWYKSSPRTEMVI